METIILEWCYGKLLRTVVSLLLHQLKPFSPTGLISCLHWHVSQVRTENDMGKHLQFVSSKEDWFSSIWTRHRLIALSCSVLKSTTGQLNKIGFNQGQHVLSMSPMGMLSRKNRYDVIKTFLIYLFLKNLVCSRVNGYRITAKSRHAFTITTYQLMNTMSLNTNKLHVVFLN